jgi:hypothetical protein
MQVSYISAFPEGNRQFTSRAVHPGPAGLVPSSGHNSPGCSSPTEHFLVTCTCNWHPRQQQLLHKSQLRPCFSVSRLYGSKKNSGPKLPRPLGYVSRIPGPTPLPGGNWCHDGHAPPSHALGGLPRPNEDGLDGPGENGLAFRPVRDRNSYKF